MDSSLIESFELVATDVLVQLRKLQTFRQDIQAFFPYIDTDTAPLATIADILKTERDLQFDFWVAIEPWIHGFDQSKNFLPQVAELIKRLAKEKTDAGL